MAAFKQDYGTLIAHQTGSCYHFFYNKISGRIKKSSHHYHTHKQCLS